jgi:hypothetical protein
VRNKNAAAAAAVVKEANGGKKYLLDFSVGRDYDCVAEEREREQEWERNHSSFILNCKKSSIERQPGI